MTSPPAPPSLIDRITHAVLYEGYILYPYRPSIKNTQRWTFGGLYPKAYCLAQDPDLEKSGEPVAGADSWLMQTQCLLQGRPQATVTVTARFLHLVLRTVGQLHAPLPAWPADSEPAFQAVPTLTIDDHHFHTWQEALERTVPAGEFSLAELIAQPRRIGFSFPATRSLEPLPLDSNGLIRGLLCRTQQPLTGTIELSAQSLPEDLTRLTVRIVNHTQLKCTAKTTRDDALLRSFISTHTILTTRHGRFTSLIDPPAACKQAATACQNLGTWPVLVGTAPAADTLLSSPIILYDYPQIAPESPGTLYDSTEIDEILTLRIMTLTDQERQDMLSVDEHARALLQRTDSLGAADLQALHGTLRNVHPSTPSGASS